MDNELNFSVPVPLIFHFSNGSVRQIEDVVSIRKGKDRNLFLKLHNGTVCEIYTQHLLMWEM